MVDILRPSASALDCARRLFGRSLKALRDPYPGNVWCPTGGVSVESVPTWFDAGASFVGLGGPLIKGGAENIGANVHAFMHAIVRAREVKS